MLPERIFAGPGEMVALCREKDWATTPLGPVETWPQSLQTAATLTLASGLPTMLLWGPDLTQIYNDPVAPILGSRHPGALGAPARECWADIWDRTAPVLARVLGGETVVRRDSVYPLSPVDTHVRYFTVSFAPIRDEAGAVSGAVVAAVETTEEVAARAEAERARDQAEALSSEIRGHRSLLDAVLDQMPSGVSIANASAGQIVYRNEEATRLLGHALRRDERGDPGGKYGALRDDGSLLDSKDYPLMRAVRGEVVTAEEFVYRRPDGTLTQLSVNAAPVRNEEGAIVAAVSTYFDISDRRAAERALALHAAEADLQHRRLEAVLDLLPVAVWITDDAGRIVRANSAVATIWGGPPPDNVGPDLFHDVFRGWRTDGTRVGQGEWALSRALRGETTGPVEIEIETFGGERKTILNFGIPILDGQGGIAGGVALDVDISDRKRSEEELRRAKETAEQASEVKSQFLSTISHELRTPLTAVTGLSDLLETEVLGPLNDQQKKQLKRIRSSAWHLVRIIDEILTFSRTEAGKELIRTAPVDVGDVVGSVTALLEAEAEIKGVELRVEIPGDLALLDTDEGKLRQIVMNLVGNAVKFTDAGRVDVVVSSSADEVLVAVGDTGPGIAAEWLGKVFEPFIQVDSSTTRSKGGTGLGLTVSRKLARLLGGDVEAKSEPGVGSTFTLRLTRVQ